MEHRKLNTSPSTIEEKEVLKKPLCEPMVRKIDLHFPLGLEVTARNLKGVTIKDALDAIYKQFKKKVCSHVFTSPCLQRIPCLTCLFYRLMTSSTIPTLLASSGIRRNATPVSSYIKRQQAHLRAPSPRKRRAMRRSRHIAYSRLHASEKYARRETFFLALFLKAAVWMEADDDMRASAGE